MKVIPSQIEFTLPSPKLGIESLPVVDPPWLPKIKTKINTIHDSGQVSRLNPLQLFLHFSFHSFLSFIFLFIFCNRRLCTTTTDVYTTCCQSWQQ
jgi:hypothetical protein